MNVKNKAEGSGTAALTAEADGMDPRQFNARAFKSAESTTPSAVKSAPDHADTLCRQFSARLFKSVASTEPFRSESPSKKASLNPL